MDFSSVDILGPLTRGGVFVGLYFVLFLLAKYIKNIFTPYKIDHELTQTDNFAIALAMSGYYLGTAAIFTGVLIGPSHGLLEDVVLCGGYAALGLAFLNMSRWFNDKLILSKFCDTEQLVKERNVGVGAVHFGAYLATGIIAAGAVSGQGGSALTAVVFFILGQISLILFSFVYAKTSSYDIHDELLKKNTASGVAFGGNLIALSLIIMNASSGDFVNWAKDLTDFLVANFVAFAFLPLIRFVMDRLIVPKSSLGQEIRQDKNVGAGLLEATVAISFAVILTRVI